MIFAQTRRDSFHAPAARKTLHGALRIPLTTPRAACMQLLCLTRHCFLAMYLVKTSSATRPPPLMAAARQACTCAAAEMNACGARKEMEGMRQRREEQCAWLLLAWLLNNAPLWQPHCLSTLLPLPLPQRAHLTCLSLSPSLYMPAACIATRLHQPAYNSPFLLFSCSSFAPIALPLLLYCHSTHAIFFMVCAILGCWLLCCTLHPLPTTPRRRRRAAYWYSNNGGAMRRVVAVRPCPSGIHGA